MTIVPVILAGGVGERFWPLSRATYPKQLLAIATRRSMLIETLARARSFTKGGVRPLIVTGVSIAPKVRQAALSLMRCDIIAEPTGKNTAPAVAIAAAWVTQRYGGDAVMAVLPADHAIAPARAFANAVRDAARIAADRDLLVVFGVKPLRPDTGYGYVELGAQIPGGAAASFVVKRFVEKPDAAKAQRYLKSGRFVWNSGMFVWKASVILAELRRAMPALHVQAMAAARAGFTKRSLAVFYRDCVKESIDYGVMERSRRVAAVCGAFAWDDAGSWDALPRLRGTPRGGATIEGPRIYAAGCPDSIIVNQSPLHLSAVGLEHVALIATRDAVLAIDRRRLPELKKHLAAMKNAGFAPQLF